MGTILPGAQATLMIFRRGPQAGALKRARAIEPTNQLAAQHGRDQPRG
jgi:hypothetical protein